MRQLSLTQRQRLKLVSTLSRARRLSIRYTSISRSVHSSQRAEHFATALSRLSAMHLNTQAIGQDCISAVRLYSSTYLPTSLRDMLFGSLSTAHVATTAEHMVCGSTAPQAESAVSAAMLIWTSAMWTILRRSRRQG